tara:strand:- start:685 stop:1392 length:708 start_codon:yes stop_codon:yes gene_type:complete
MQPTHIFTNGCSFLTQRPKEGVDTHVGMEMAKLMDLETALHLGAGGRGNRRCSITTKVWCEKNPDLAEKCFFVIGITSGQRFDYPATDRYKQHKFPALATAWKTYKPHINADTKKFFKYLFITGKLDLDQMIQYESIEATLNLQNYFKINNYPYVMYKTISDPEIKVDFKFKDVKTLWHTIDKTRYFRPETSHKDYIIENNQLCSPGDLHPSAEGHSDWATQLKDFIDANDLRTI